MPHIEKIVTFTFDYGNKKIEDCSREELIEIVELVSVEILKLHERQKRDAEIQVEIECMQTRHDLNER